MDEKNLPYTLSELIDSDQLRLMAEACHLSCGLPVSIVDAHDGSLLIGAGWQDICAKFHRPHPVSGQRCRSSLLSVQKDEPDGAVMTMCQNGLRHVEIPMFIEGRHVATFSLTQFLLDTDGKDVEYFRRQSVEMGYDTQAYLQALDSVPVLAQEQLDRIVEYTLIFSRLIATLAGNTLHLKQENAVKERIQAELRERAMFTEQLVNAMASPVFIKDRDGIYTGCNAAFNEFIGLSREELLGKSVFDLYAKKEAAVYHQKDVELMNRGGTQVYDFTLRTNHGEIRDVQFSKAVTYDAQHAISGIIGVVTDLTERKRSEKSLHDSEEQFRFLAEHSIDIIWRLDSQQVITYVSPADERMRGYPPEEVVGHAFIDIVHPGQVKQMRAAYASYLEDLRSGFTQAPFRTETPLICRDGRRLWVEVLFNPIRDRSGGIAGFHCVGRDVGLRKAREEEIQFQSSHDALTGLHNRAFFDTEFKRIGQGRFFPLSLIVGDVDGLKDVNERSGQAAGDRLLRGVGEILRAAFRAGDLVARMGGDEFAVLLSKTGAQSAQEAMARIREEQRRFNAAHAEFTLSLSLGSATAQSRDGLEQLALSADWNMYADKAVNKNRRAGE